MKKLLILLVVGLSAMTLLSGCIVVGFGGGTKCRSDANNPTLGLQLQDLQKARDTGAITDAEYQVQKAKLLNKK